MSTVNWETFPQKYQQYILLCSSQSWSALMNRVKILPQRMVMVKLRKLKSMMILINTLLSKIYLIYLWLSPSFALFYFRSRPGVALQPLLYLIWMRILSASHSLAKSLTLIGYIDEYYLIKIYGTVVARDQIDYRCVNLFKHGRDNPQCITSMDDALTLTGLYRALAGEVMFFEFNLKIIGDEEAVDKEFSKGLMECRTITSDLRPRTLSHDSCLSKVEMEFIDIPFALEASVEVNILNEESYFHGKITAGYQKNGMILYDSRVAGTETKLGSGGSVPLTRRVVAIPWDDDLVLGFSVPRVKPKSKCIRFEHDEEE